MTMPSSLELNSSIIMRIFAQMPNGFSRDPLAIDAINFFIDRQIGTEVPEDGPAVGLIRDGVFTIKSLISSVKDEELILKNYTIQSLHDYFNNKRDLLGYGIYCTINSSFPLNRLNKSAHCLMEGSLIFDGTGTSWPAFTSENYSLISAIALAIIDNQQNMLNAIKQTDQNIASKDWLDYWGSVLGVQRIAAEIDSDLIYRNRMQRDSVLPKSNNWAIASLLRGATGRTIYVNDGGQPFLLVATEFDTPSVSHLGSPTTFSSPSYIGIGTNSDINDLSTNGNPKPASAESGNSSGLFKIGPNTGSGGFVVKVEPDISDGTLSQTLSSYIYELVSKYKPAGIPFTIQAL